MHKEHLPLLVMSDLLHENNCFSFNTTATCLLSCSRCFHLYLSERSAEYVEVKVALGIPKTLFLPCLLTSGMTKNILLHRVYFC